jgi:hypothetical protein
MTALQLNAELFRELNVIVTDAEMMEKAIKAFRRITTSHRRASKAKTTNYLNRNGADAAELLFRNTMTGKQQLRKATDHPGKTLSNKFLMKTDFDAKLTRQFTSRIICLREI